IEAGRFPARPGGDEWDPFRRLETFENCRYCPYDPVCPADRDEAWDRIRDHDEVRAYADLAEDSVTETPGDEG
ncbi:MAG TPA: hypothetical protein VM618_11950, partial [Acidimicrobiia bacterium]|nr:hypothetical protein [Acidimicrobiia bacterium]